MHKLFKSLLISVAAVFLFAGVSFASTSVRLQTPVSPTNQDTFTLTFVALDTDSSQTVNVDCYKKGPNDATYSVFQSFSLTNGGNTSNCQVTSGIMNQGNGTYSFYVTATGTGSSTSQTVSVDFNNSKPGQPVNYNKTKPDNCTYKIDFRTANDNGKTVRVVLYRSTDQSFSLDSGHQVNSINIGSDTDGSMTDNISPNCGTTYYYAIRAFDAYGNASDPNGDSSTTTTVISPTVTQQQGAIPVSGTATGTGAGTGAVLGQATSSATPSPTGKAGVSPNPIKAGASWIATHKTITLAAIAAIILVIAAGYYLYYKKRKS